MLGHLWNTAFYTPLYNALFFIVSLIPGGDIGLAIVILTLIVKLALFPLSKKSITSQVKMKQLEPEIKKIKAASKARHPFRITDADGCGRFTGRVIRNVNAAAPTPA